MKIVLRERPIKNDAGEAWDPSRKMRLEKLVRESAYGRLDLLGSVANNELKKELLKHLVICVIFTGPSRVLSGAVWWLIEYKIKQCKTNL